MRQFQLEIIFTVAEVQSTCCNSFIFIQILVSIVSLASACLDNRYRWPQYKTDQASSAQKLLAGHLSAQRLVLDS